MGIGDGDWGFGDWGLGPIPNPQSPIPNPLTHELLNLNIKNNFIKDVILFNLIIFIYSEYIINFL